MTPDSQRPVVFFDGVCNLCNGVVQFIIRHDKAGRFLFASLQSKAGSSALAAIGQEHGQRPDSVVLNYKGRYYVRSSAVLRIAGLLDGPWKLLGIFRILPGAFLDLIYGFIARRRYGWFGKAEECMIPSPELKTRFLSD